MAKWLMVPLERGAKCLFDRCTRTRQAGVDALAIAAVEGELYASIRLIILQPIAKAQAQITELNTWLAARAADGKAGLSVGERQQLRPECSIALGCWSGGACHSRCL